MRATPQDAAAHPGVEGNLAEAWLKHANERAGLAVAEVAAGLSAVMAEKDAVELGFVQKAAVMSNKVLKHGFVKEMEAVFEEEGKTARHSEMATKLDEIMEDPSKIGIKVPADTIESCYFPIVQSGGSVGGYNIKPSATTDDGTMTEDVVIVALGARYKSYCANVARTYIIDAVPKVEQTYATLLKVRAECLSVMQPGTKLSEVHARATSYLEKKNRALLPHLPKSLGFSLGLDFKDSVFALSGRADPGLRFRAGMVFNLAVGFQDVELSPGERAKAKGSIKDVGKFSLLVADTVKIGEGGQLAEVLTKASVDFGEVSYTIKEDDGSGEEGSGDESGEEKGQEVKTAAGRAVVYESRLRERSSMAEDVMEAKQKRAEKQARLMERNRERALAKFKGGDAGSASGSGAAAEAEAEDFVAYAAAEQYPAEARAAGVHVDMDREAVFLPIGGVPVPFHISTIKNVAMPDPDRSAYLRLNFYTPGQALGKEAPAQMAAIVNKHKATESDQVFVKEFTFRSANATGLTSAFRLIQVKGLHVLPRRSGWLSPMEQPYPARGHQRPA